MTLNELLEGAERVLPWRSFYGDPKGPGVKIVTMFSLRETKRFWHLPGNYVVYEDLTAHRFVVESANLAWWWRWKARQLLTAWKWLEFQVVLWLTDHGFGYHKDGERVGWYCLRQRKEA
jgi:hypothetical protein